MAAQTAAAASVAAELRMWAPYPVLWVLMAGDLFFIAFGMLLLSTPPDFVKFEV